ncbi:MAG: uroporphyrinogen-III synthase [Janthinobacterium lividum]
MPHSQPGPGPPARHEVLITRPGEAADRTAALLDARGYIPVQAALFRVVPRRLEWPGRCDAILVTSGNAVPSLGSAPDVPVLTVGDATAARARESGLRQVGSAGGDAAALLAFACRRLQPPASLVLATGAGQGHALAAGLRSAGFRVHRRVAYTIRPVTRLPEAARAAIIDQRLHAVLFLSADTARIFRRLLPAAMQPALAGIEALAIAPAVGEVLAPLPWRRVRVSVAPTLDQVLALL